MSKSATRRKVEKLLKDLPEVEGSAFASSQPHISDFQVLIRDPNDEYGEKEAMDELGISYVENRTKLGPGKTGLSQLVIGRYSVLPFYRELEEDIKYAGKFYLINNYSQFRYCSDLGNWYRDFEGSTPKTWFTLQEYLASDYEGPVVLKGETNSRRDKWATHMFANNKDEAREVYCRLLDDGLISQQKIYIRKYEKLVKLIDGVNGMPIPNEWRIFVLYGQVISCSFYWGTYLEDIKEKGITPRRPPKWNIDMAVSRVGSNSNFYSIDIAQLDAYNEWTVIELNEGQMSGLNGVEPKEFYSNMKKVLDNLSEK